jgi:SAM-dependent methyltransferase
MENNPLDRLEYYEGFYYGYQVKGRGLETAKQLKPAFEIMANNYESLFLPLLPEDRQVRCVDLACGYGNFLYALREFGFRDVVGFDLDQAQVALARELGLDARIGDACELIKNQTNLGLISALDLIEHLDKNTAVKLLEDMYKSLAPNGVILIRCPCADGFTGSHDICNDLTHRWGATSNMFGQLLRAVGFTEVRIIDETIQAYPRRWGAKLKNNLRIVSRSLASPVLAVLGIKAPNIWSNSMFAVARRPA